MPKENSTSIVVVLDRSGSMESIRADTIGGFNSFVRDQKKLAGECRLTQVQFDTQAVETVYLERPISEVPDLTAATFVPRGGTPLLDAMGRTINEVGSRLAVRAEAERPSQVIMVIITDGQENASHEFSRQRVFDMITHQKERYGWLFVYLGANQDAIHEAAQYGIGGTFAMSFSPSAAGTRSSYAMASNKVGMMRSSGLSGTALYANKAVMDSMGFDADERAQAMADVLANVIPPPAEEPKKESP